MTIKKTKGFARAVAIVLAAAILGAASAPAVTGDGDEVEKGVCKTALKNCFRSALESALTSLGSSVLTAIPYCLNGYFFCEKYIAPYLDGGCL